MKPSDPIKIVIVGPPGVGKTCLAKVFRGDSFNEHEKSTVGSGFVQHTVDIDGAFHTVQLWDTAGQEKFKALMPLYYRGAAGALVVYETGQLESFRQARGFFCDLRNIEPRADAVVCANKDDLVPAGEVEGHAQQWADSTGGVLGLVSTSAKTGHNVQEAVVALVRHLLRGEPEEARASVALQSHEQPLHHRRACGC